MAPLHPGLTQERWNGMDCSRQLLNAAAELSRARHRLDRSPEDARASLERVLELLDMSANDRAQWRGNRLRELLRLREAVAQFYAMGAAGGDSLEALLRALLLLSPATAAVEI